MLVFKEWYDEEENNLFIRLKYDNKKMDSKIHGDRDEILYFLKDFRVPSTNNNAEASQRGVKIKQKIGKFRSEEGAEAHLNIRSCILTYKKQNIDILNAIKSIFDNKPVIAWKKVRENSFIFKCFDWTVTFFYKKCKMFLQFIGNWYILKKNCESSRKKCIY